MQRCRRTQGSTAFPVTAKSLAVVVAMFGIAPTVAQTVPENASPNPYIGGWSCNHGYAQNGGHCVKVVPPENAGLNYLGNGWQCNRGFQQVGASCVKVEVPENAGINYLGNGWECNRGYRQSGARCIAVTPPENASLNYLGNGWQCNRGFRQSASTCVKVGVPEHANLNYLGDGWQCDAGYIQSLQSCVRLAIPEHAHLEFTGHAWTCDQGFKRVGDRCSEMTAQEVQKQKDEAAAISALINRRRAQRVSGQSCDTEDRTGANVCVSITNVDLDCHKNFDESAFTGCDANVSYSLKTDYRGNSSLDASVECTVEISYAGRNTYSTRTDSESDESSHDLGAYDSQSGEAEISFSFSSLDEVTKAKVSSAECRIASVDLD
jgi:hypothetical protein